MTSPDLDVPADLAAGDEAALRRLLRFGGPSLLDSLSQMFATHAPTRVGAMRDALAQGDAKGVELAAHSLKSSSAQLGALRLERLCRAAEARAHAGDLGGMDVTIEQMEQERAAFAAWLATARETLGPA